MYHWIPGALDSTYTSWGAFEQVPTPSDDSGTTAIETLDSRAHGTEPAESSTRPLQAVMFQVQAPLAESKVSIFWQGAEESEHIV
mmetsp:Transcript_16218/g.43492  ORF Transcript_16218/g.43492 Transcript_16218/m.43492 type:complete len:85 (+) Transcript_16218:115-369(+)